MTTPAGNNNVAQKLKVWLGIILAVCAVSAVAIGALTGGLSKDVRGARDQIREHSAWIERNKEACAEIRRDVSGYQARQEIILARQEAIQEKVAEISERQAAMVAKQDAILEAVRELR